MGSRSGAEGLKNGGRSLKMGVGDGKPGDAAGKWQPSGSFG